MEDPIPGGFSEVERERFRNLLELAARTPFEGERANALAAAARLAARHGMTLEEAARGAPLEPPDPPPPPRTDAFAAAFARAVHLMDAQIALDKLRREAALRAARARGLDVHMPAPPRAARRPRLSRSRRNPYSLARLLIRETSLPLREIVDITGLDIYEIVAMKLKMRQAA